LGFSEEQAAQFHDVEYNLRCNEEHTGQNVFYGTRDFEKQRLK